MHYSRFIAFLFTIAIFGMLAASGQTPGSSTSQVPAAVQASPSIPPATALSPQQDSSPNMQPPAPLSLTTPLGRIKIKLVPGHTHTVIIRQQRDQPLDPRIDQGI